MKVPPLLLMAVLSLHGVFAHGQPRPAASPWPFGSRATPSPASNGDRSKLLEGVKTIPKLGVPGPVVAYGPQAFPLVISRGANFSEAIAAAASMGKGRVVIFGHTGYLNAGGGGDLDRLLLNAVRWCGQRETPRVGLKGSTLAPVLAGAGLRAETIAKVDKKTLQGCDVLVYSAQGLADPGEAEALKEFVQNGGGLIAGVTGWAFGQTSGGKEFATAHLGNSLLAEAGVAWTSESIGNGTIEVATDVSPALNAATAVAALQVKPGDGPPAPGVIAQATRTLQLALAAIPTANRAALQHSLGAVLGARENPPLPSAASPLKTGADDALRARAAINGRLSRFLAPADVTPNPAADLFPGRVKTGTRTITKAVSIDPSIPGWQSTGLYADAGAKIVVKLPPECVGARYGVRIGCHTDDLSALESWSRIPEISLSISLAAAETSVASAFGGLVYITVPEKSKQAAAFSVSISGGVEAPFYVLGQTTDSQWQAMHQLAAPWAELACKGVIITVPAAVAREVQKPAELMQFWQSVVDAEDDLAGTTAQRRRPERIVPDVQISAGYMHSGYPIMIHLPQASEMVLHGPAQWPGWGFYHELGHNHQNPVWTFPGTTEVTCNLFSLYVVETIQHQPMLEGHSAIKPDAQQKKRAQYLAGGARFEQWQNDPFLALGLYIQLIQGFGFDPLKKVLRSYQGDEFGPPPKTDEEKHDQWMIRYAKITGKNLGPFFETWGIPVSSGAKAAITSLPAWMPPEMAK